ncbi:MAG: ThiF family adenylyltransferase [Candidatus Hermodarchaeota archaeon]
MNTRRDYRGWNAFYSEFISRNIGLVSMEDQEKIRNSSIAIFGIGGLGGSLAEELTRTGCEHIKICDNGVFEVSNLNRQLCSRDDIGKYKVDVVETLLKKINPGINVKKEYEVNKTNISNILESTTLVALTLDDPITSILIARECLNYKIPMIESWGIPYLWVWWFTHESIDYESCYGFQTNEKSIDSLLSDPKLLGDIKSKVFKLITQFPEIRERYSREKNIVEKMASGELPFVSFAPIVRITASYLAFEIVFSGITQLKRMELAPNINGYDYFSMKPIKFKLYPH